MNDRAMSHTLPLIFVFIFGGIALIATTMIFLFGLQIVAEFYDAVLPLIDPIGDTTGEDLSDGIGNAFGMFAVIVPLGIVGSVLLAVLVGGNGGASQARQPPSNGGPPF